MSYRLGLNTGFAVNRFCEPEEWALVARSSGVQMVQFTADLLNVSLPAPIVASQTKRIIKACTANEIEIGSTFTGAFTRVNHLAHPDQDVRKYWISWFKDFASLSVDLGATSMGSHFGILSQKDDSDPLLRQERVNQNVESWHEIGEFAAAVGLEYLTWEPMSISREQGETIAKCRAIQTRVNESAPIPFKICLDVDHGDQSSGNPDDVNPYAWIREFSRESPILHLKQSLSNKSGHWPFTREFNEQGIIVPEKVLDLLTEQGASDVDLVLEISFRERQPADSSVLEVLTESVNFWKKHIL